MDWIKHQSKGLTEKKANEIYLRLDASNDPVTGAIQFQNTTDSTTAFQILDADGGNPVFNVDTTNERVGIGTDTPLYSIHRIGADGGATLLERSAGQPQSLFITVGTNSHGAGVTNSTVIGYKSTEGSYGRDGNICFKPGAGDSSVLIVEAANNNVYVANTGSGKNQGFGVGVNPTEARVHFVGYNPAQPLLICQAVDGQTENLQEWRASDGTIVAYLNIIGGMKVDDLKVDGFALGAVGFTVKSPFPQTTNIFQVITQSDEELFAIKSDGGVIQNLDGVINGTLLDLKLSAGHSGDIFRVKTSGDANLFVVDSTGRVGLPDGTAANPALNFISDTDCGLYKIGDNRFGMAAGGVGIWDAQRGGQSFYNQAALTVGDAFRFNRAAGDGLTDTDAEQAWIELGVKVTQTDTANYVGLLMDVTESSTGSGTNELMALRVGGTDRFTIGNDAATGITLSDAASVGLTVKGADSQSANLQEWQDSAGNVQALIDANGGAVFNEEGNAVNFRIESDGLDDVLFVDGTNNRIGIGTDAPAVELHFVGAYGQQRWQRPAGQPNTYNINMTSSNGTGANGSLFFRNIQNTANICFAAYANGTAQLIINGSQQNTVLAANTGTGLNQGLGVGVAHDFTDSRFIVAGWNTAKPVAILRAPASHADNILEIQDSASDLLTKIDKSGNVGVRMGDTALTAYLHLAAGTADAGNAPLKFTDGTALGTPEEGVMNFVDNRFCITNVATCRRIDRTSDVAVETVTVANTTDETTMWTGVMPANSLVAGNMFKFHADGLVSNDGNHADNDITIRVRVGGTEVVSLTPATKALTDVMWHIDANACQRTIGESGARAIHLHLVVGDVDEQWTIAVATVDTTANMDVTVTAEWATAKATNTISLYQGFMEYKN